MGCRRAQLAKILNPQNQNWYGLPDAFPAMNAFREFSDIAVHCYNPFPPHIQLLRISGRTGVSGTSELSFASLLNMQDEGEIAALADPGISAEQPAG